MNAATERFTLAGPAGTLECAVDQPEGSARGLAVIAHPHPLHGGTMDNKVVQTLARAAVLAGLRAVRFNFRGIGGSAGSWDAGQGEVDDAMAVITAERALQPAGAPLLVAGFSFGGYVASQAAARLAEAGAPAWRVVLVAPAVVNFTAAPVPPGSLVVHGELDDVVPLKAALDWARPQLQPVTVLPGAGHFFHGNLPQLRQTVLAALQAP